MPTFVDGFLDPDPNPATFRDSTLTRFYYDQSFDPSPGSNLALTFYGDVYPTVIETDFPESHYYRVDINDCDSQGCTQQNSGFGVLTQEVLDKIDPFVDFSHYDVNNNGDGDGVIDYLYLMIRSPTHADAINWQCINGSTHPLCDDVSPDRLLPTYSGVSDLQARSGSISDTRWVGGSPPSLAYDGKDLNWQLGTIAFVRAPQIPYQTGMIHLAAHEVGHDIWSDMYTHLSYYSGNGAPLNPPGNPDSAVYGYLLMSGGSNHPAAQGNAVISAREREVRGWIQSVELTEDQIAVQLPEIYSSGISYRIPLPSAQLGVQIILSNHQTVGYFNQRHKVICVGCNPPNLQVDHGLRTTGLHIQYVGESVTFLMEPLAADNTLQKSNFAIDFQGDLYGPDTKTQITPWTRPNISGCSTYSDINCDNPMERIWSAIDNIHYLADDPDSTLVFDFYADYRDVAETAIRADSWMGAETSGSVFTGLVRVTNNSTLTIQANTELTFEQDLIVDIGSTLLIEEGATLRFGPGASLHADGLLTATGLADNRVTLQRQFPLSAWEGILINGANSLLKLVKVDGASVGVEVAALNVTINNARLTNNGTGILTDFEACIGQTCSDARSTLTLKKSRILNSTGVGLHARHTNISADDNEISGSGFMGVLVEDADLVPFTNNVVTGNGAMLGHGISVISGGDLTMGPLAGYGGYNMVYDNVHHELRVNTGGTLLVGTSAAGGDNSVYKTSGVGTPTARYISNGLGGLSLVPAENTWWGVSTGPPAGAFTGIVDYTPYLDCPPTNPPTCFAGVTQTSADGRGGSESGARGEDWHAWLKAEIVAARRALNETPTGEGMAAVVNHLAHMQRLDRTDELGERNATMALLVALRQLLNESPTANARAVGEAAMVSEVRASLYEADYETARNLLRQFGPLVLDYNNRIVLDLAAVSLLEQAGDYANALSLIQTIIAELPQEESELAQELTLSAAVIEMLAVRQNGGNSQSPFTAPSSSVVTETVVSYALDAAYPNPFNPSVTVPFAVPEAAHVKVEIFDVLGRRVAILADNPFETGRHTLRFDGSHLASGVYVLRALMEAESGTSARAFTQRLTLLK